MPVFTVIDHTELSGNAASYNVTSIPSSYDHLYLVTSLRTDDVQFFDQLGLRFNGDTGSNYSWTRLNAGSGTPSGGYGSGTSIEYLYGATGTEALANTFGTMTTWIPNYSGTVGFTQTIHDWAQENNNANNYYWFIGMIAGLWQDTSAVDQITLTPIDGDDFVQYSTFTLYGVTGA